MKKGLKRLVAGMLCALTLTSCYAGLATVAAEESESAVTQATMTEAAAAEAESNTANTADEEIEFHGATGDLSTEADLEGVEKIETVSDYYEVTGNDTKPQARMRSAATLPSKVDNSDSEYFPEVDSQGRINSCTAWAQVYYQFTYEMNKSLGRKTTPENTFSPKWAYNMVNEGVDKGSSLGDIYSVLKYQGAATLEQVSYDSDYLSWSPDEDIWSSTGDYKIADYQRLKYGNGDTPITSPDDEDLEVIKTALSNGDILTYSTYINSWKYSEIEKNEEVPENENYAGERIVTVQLGTKGSHRMTIVGYNDDIWVDINGDGSVQEQEKGAFKIVNSWGKSFANDGFCWVSYDALNRQTSVPNIQEQSNRCPVFESIARIDVEPYDSDSDIILTYTLSTTDRNQVRVYMVQEDESFRREIEVVPYNIADAFGSYSYDGTNESNDCTMCYDLGDVIDDLNSYSFKYSTWSVKIVDKKADGNEVTVKDLKITDKNTGKVYEADGSLPIALDGQTRTLDFYRTANTPTATIYYSGYSNPYIHYQVGNGSWTTAPGVKMQASSEMSGYTHKYTINLGSEGHANVCFNDGGSSWDNNGGNNYRFEAGTYTFKNGVITFIPSDTELEFDSFDVTSENAWIQVNDTVDMSVTLRNAPSGAVCKFLYKDSNGNDHSIQDFSEKLSATGEFYNPGTYTLVAQVKDSKNSSKVLDTTEKTITVLPELTEENSATIYYKGYSDPYIHYQVGSGSWTTAPGVKMQQSSEVSGFTHKYVIYIGDEGYANVCFNDGGNSWDGSGDRNYRFGNGTYTYQNGVITQIESPKLRIESIKFTPEKSGVGIYETIKAEVDAAGGTAPYQYQYAMYKYGATTVLQDYSEDNTFSYQFIEPSTFDLVVNVKDATGKVVSQSKSVTVLQMHVLQLNPDKENAKIGESVTFTPKTTNESSAFTSENYFYTVTKDGKTQSLTTNSDKTVTWIPTEAGDYTVKLEVKYGDKLIYTKSVNYTVAEGELKISSLKLNPENGYLGIYGTLEAEVEAVGGTAPYQYQFSYWLTGTNTVIADYSDNNTVSHQFVNPTTYTLVAKVKDATGKVVSQSKKITVAQMHVLQLDPDKENAQVGESITFTPKTTNESSAFTSENYFYTVTKDGKTQSLTTNSDKTVTWTPTEAGDYTVKLEVKYGDKLIYTKSVNYTVAEGELKISSLKLNPENGYLGIYGTLEAEVEAVGGTAPYQYQFSYWLTGTNTVIADYSDNNTVSHQFVNPTTYTLVAKVKDATGKVVSQSKSVTVAQMHVLQLNPDKENAKVGESVTFTPKTTNEASVFTAENYFYTVTKDGKTQNLTTNSDKTVTWTPNEAGDYTLKLEVKYGDKLIYTKSVNYTAADASETQKITIFYKGYSTPYIHYQVGSGSWTAVPGVKMEESSEMSGYTHKYTIDLGTESYANVCFNNGSGSWDSNGGNNYRFESGTYTYENGVITPVDNDDKFGIASFTITPESGQIYAGESVTMRVALKNSTSSAVCQFLYVKDGEEHVIYDYAGSIGGSYQFSQPGVYTLMVKAKDNPYSTEVVTAEKTITVLPKDDKFGIESFTITPENGQIYVGESVQMRVALKNSTSSAVCQFLYVKNGNEHVIYDYAGSIGGSYQFSQPGVYTLMVKAKESLYSTEVVTAEQTVTVLPKPGENSMTIYYKGYSTPYIHYQVGSGSWTAVPGVKMEESSEISGYTHKYTIDLGTESYANVCFNNGSGSWDSNGGRNYRFEAGTYTYENGKLTKIG